MERHPSWLKRQSSTKFCGNSFYIFGFILFYYECSFIEMTGGDLHWQCAIEMGTKAFWNKCMERTRGKKIIHLYICAFELADMFRYGNFIMTRVIFFLVLWFSLLAWYFFFPFFKNTHDKEPKIPVLYTDVFIVQVFQDYNARVQELLILNVVTARLTSRNKDFKFAPTMYVFFKFCASQWNEPPTCFEYEQTWPQKHKAGVEGFAFCQRFGFRPCSIYRRKNPIGWYLISGGWRQLRPKVRLLCHP